MAFSSDVIQRASLALEQRRTQHQSQQRMMRSEIYEAVPEIGEIEKRLRSGMLAVVQAALDHSADPEKRVLELKEENLRLRRLRAELLQENGYDEDALDDKPLCPKCEDRGWVGSTMCECLRQLCAQEQIRSLSSMLDLGEQSFDTFSLDWYSTEFDEELGLSPRENMAMVCKICRNYAEKFGKYMVHNLFLTGAPGLGKTFLSAAIARVVSEKGFSVVYDTAVNTFTCFENAKFGRGEDAEAAVERYLHCDLLILDDLGSEMNGQMTQSALYTILNTRLNEDRHTVISSNLSVEDIRRRYPAMIASRIEGEYREMTFVGEDIRVQRKNQY